MDVPMALVVAVVVITAAPFVLLWFVVMLMLAQWVVEKFCAVMQIKAGVIEWTRTEEGQAWVKGHWATKALARRSR
jgi:hypothetical protein